MPLLGSLMILGIGLITAILFQLRFGLRPLRALEASLAQVRRGTAREIPTQQPLELRGLVSELNALIDQNQAGLANARRHVANLAHGLKTPLAALKVKLAQSGCDGDGELGALVARMDSSVSHHLARARAASPGGPGRHTKSKFRSRRTWRPPVIRRIWTKWQEICWTTPGGGRRAAFGWKPLPLAQCFA
jgi:hypothetical protein